jgi:hypothetical protein
VDAPVFGGGFNSLFQVVAKRELLLVDILFQHFDPFFGDRCEQLVGGVGEQLHAVVEQLVGHGTE